MGWNGTEQLQALMQRGATETEVRNAFIATESNFVTAGTTEGDKENNVFAGDAQANAFSCYYALAA